MKKVGLVQLRASQKKEENLDKILRYIEDASKKGAALCAFPEFMMFYTPSTQTASDLAKLAEPINGHFVSTIADAAKENSIEVICTFYEKSRLKNRVYDTSFLLSSSGKVISKYRKTHLYDAMGFKESKKLAPGSQLPKPQKSRIGTIGMLICYDLRFPEISRLLASAGTQILVAPSAWVQGEMKEQHWITLNQTRAIENGCYIISPDQVGNIYCGRSMVVDPLGRILLDMKKKQGIGFVEISDDKIKNIRRALPLLKNRRTDLYSIRG